jgi:beta-glucosidase
MIPHGYAENEYDAAKLAINAGSDMDMEGYCYKNNLPELVTKGEVPLENLDDAVRRILRKKFEMGLFENPFRFVDPVREEKALNNPEHRLIARDVARKSIVLLKNEGNLLPIKKGSKIALIGPLAKSEDDMLGGWAIGWDDNSDVVSQFEGFEIKFGKENLLYAKGCEVSDSSKDGFEEAFNIAKMADVVVLSIGENRSMNGEAASRSNIGLPGVQEELVYKIMETGKPVILLINAGRPLVFNRLADNVPSILYTWWLGSEAGNAIADVVSGDYNPSGKLTVSFPRNEGQIPIYYNHFNTGRPSMLDIPSKDFRTGYIDLQQSPKFPFGYGLSYTTFDYSDLNLSSEKLNKNGSIEVSVNIKNTGE